MICVWLTYCVTVNAVLHAVMCICIASIPRQWWCRWEAYTRPAVIGIPETSAESRIGCCYTGE